MMSFLKKLVDTEYKELRRFNKLADKIEALEEEYSKKSDHDLASKTAVFKERLASGETLDDILVEAFATAREVCYRQIGEKPYRVQLIGGMAIHYGNIAEMKTGEGKTITTVLPAYLNGLSGKGVHVVTVNEYLTARNAEWMGPIYKFLGVSVGVNLRELTPAEKQDVYNCDITYSTNNEIGFDYLRDNMVAKKDDRVQRPLNYVIIDEVDSVLIDEARTPLIISGGKMNAANLYQDSDKAVKKLKNEEDYKIDEKIKSVMLTEAGSHKLESYFKLNNLYDADNTALVHHINQALKANYGMKNDVDYVIEESQIIIVDQFTGRLMHGRQFSEGLHQAIEAKENVKINEETKTMATITFQNLFRMYNKLAGMTGTAKTEEEEFRDIYNMYVIEIPTNKPCTRQDMDDLMFATEKGKYNAIVSFIKEIHETGQPILVGTISVESNEHLSSLLTKAKLKHEVLNAKNHAREAEIIEKAGEKYSITIATNMAGRGTDIKLGVGVKDLGGLCVIGTERHESRRIDNQLRGRAGRQGDPGYSQFFISFEDDLMRRFGTDRVKTMIQSIGYDETQPLRSKMFSKSIESAQKKVEGNNYDARKNLLDYDNIVSEQRKIIYERRNQLLDADDTEEIIYLIINDFIRGYIESVIPQNNIFTEEDYQKITDYFNNNLLKNNKIKINEINNLKEEELIKYIYDKLIEDYQEKLKNVPKEISRDFEKYISIRVIDEAWVNHISSMEHLREGIGLRGYGQTNPLQAYALEGYQIFDQMLDTIDTNITRFLMKVEINQNAAPKTKQVVHTNDGKEKLKSAPKKATKIGRNDPCPCKSGKKYKQCCGK
ncbi:MAG: preprotein translocase subunit SecA [Bacilli bacterium]|nr:preprotein translocase subunit SecA [Bacilli bacterium]MDD4795512.1 preprotein translocase subunit SecA [Bacilli bacterium]